MIVVGLTDRFPFHFDPKLLQIFQICIDTLPFRRHFIPFQLPQDLRHCNIMFFIGFFQHDFREII